MGKFCTKCGKEIKENYEFCSECENKMNSNNINKNKKKKTNPWLIIFIIVISVIGVITIIITIISIYKNANERKGAIIVEEYGKTLETKYYTALMTDTTTQFSDIKVNNSKVTCRKQTLNNNGKVVLTGCKVDGIDTTYNYSNGAATPNM
ncbi:MAG: zinc ribbon domain-containing protein [Clostridium sp.]|nr:zinc ribbon domain-containing protein [Clostridium sp.]MCM1443951.1 zinc ribbon domain-containing protein [Candidatus Amulumruptor caecigallinarius]